MCIHKYTMIIYEYMYWFLRIVRVVTQMSELKPVCVSVNCVSGI